MKTVKFVSLCLCFLSLKNAGAQNNQKFPEDFKFGVATAAYQIEGAWNQYGKGENIWDHLTHTRPEHIKNKDNGDIACDSYHKYKEDVALLKDMGVDFYRFSLSWSRILPTGFIHKINWEGVEYYNNLIDELLKNNIEPMVTIYHWDLPQPLQELGGWPNPLLEEYYIDYARLCFKLFGRKVKIWTTFNEPRLICLSGYGDAVMAPALNSSGVGEYLCGHTVLKAHARAYHMYNEEFREEQKGKISLVLDFQWILPKTNTTEDEDVAEITRHFMFGWFANPIYIGNYPKQMIDLIAERSTKQGFLKSRLPAFTKDEIEYIKGTSDFLGLNSYTTFLVTPIKDYSYDVISLVNDISVTLSHDPDWEHTAQPLFKFVPWGTRGILNWIKKTYNNPEVIITENGCADNGTTLDDEIRTRFFKENLQAVLDAKYIDKVHVTGYTAWSLLDNFEWVDGYTLKFGFYHVDFSSPNKTRTAKKSVDYFKKVLKTHCLVENCKT